MRRILSIVTVFTLIAAALGAAAQQTPTQVTPKLKDVLDQMKAYAASRPGMTSKIPQGTFYFKWLQAPPPDFEKAYFKFGELNVGKKFLSLNLIRKTSAGVELVILNDNDMNGSVEEAYKATGRTLADADRAITTSSEKLKVPVTPDMITNWNAMVEELRWELKSN